MLRENRLQSKANHPRKMGIDCCNFRASMTFIRTKFKSKEFLFQRKTVPTKRVSSSQKITQKMIQLKHVK